MYREGEDVVRTGFGGSIIWAYVVGLTGEVKVGTGGVR